ncbi:MAG: hypothetical protein UY41_C0029G0002 [Candidatus Moranbacteria bacterium GW2011_GWE1_49_15]|nr:MAG: hypothetical protein UY41_C0029G0002 [Candidatus Moranbacteria bacterium GW2011_GWE1_49_15]
MEYLEKQEKQITNELLAFQISEYKKFIRNLTEVSNIMSKFFYLVVPFYPIENVKKGMIENLFGGSKGGDRRMEAFETYKEQLFQRVDQVSAGLTGIGLKLKPLKTEEIIELLYNSYNPVVDHNAIIKDLDKIELN